MAEFPWTVRVRVLQPRGAVTTTFCGRKDACWKWLRKYRRGAKADGRRFLDRASHPAVLTSRPE